MYNYSNHIVFYWMHGFLHDFPPSGRFVTLLYLLAPPTSNLCTSAWIKSHYQLSEKHTPRMPVCNMIINHVKTDCLAIKTSSLHSPSPRYLQMWTDRAWPQAEKQPSPPSCSLSSSFYPPSSLINPLYRFLIFIYLPECAFLPF